MGDDLDFAGPDEDGVDQMQLIKEDEVYTIATREYLANGGDGFEVYKNETIETVVDGEAGIPMSIIMRNFFWAIDSVNRLLKMDDLEKQKEIAKQQKRFSLEPARSKTSMLNLGKYSVDKDGNVNAVEAKSGGDKRVSVNVSTGKVDETKESGSGAEEYVDAITILPQLEHRIMTVEEEIDLQADNMKPMKQFFSRLPSFVNMQKLPRQQSLLVVLNEIQDAEATNDKK